MPPAPPVAMGGEPSTWEKFKMGAMMGGSVGMAMGSILGCLQVLRGAAGPRGNLATISQFALSSGATFGFFMSIGSVIRNDPEISSIPAHSPSVSTSELAAAYLQARATIQVTTLKEARKKRAEASLNDRR